ncbi:hypothetical protein [Pontibacter russatus]|uniref:hypothetical protein n=1 Tax=Pontibacter russatus TaxID=2694929 RepID=UPI001379F0B1|nr:hypothetical protein [Pontibacter russatus]
MSARSLELLLETAYDNEKTPLSGEAAGSIYKDFESAYKAARTSPAKSPEVLSFRFERLRLVIALAFVKAFTRLSHNEKSVEALDVLQDALQEKSTKDIDRVVQKRIAAFDNLYHEIFVNEQREQLLGLFEQTLDAGSKEELDELIFEGLELMQQVDWDANNDEDTDDQEPLDEDFLKNL